MNEQMLTVKQVAEITQLSYSAILQAVNNPASGLKASDLSAVSRSQRSQWRIARKDLEAWLEARSNGAGRPKPQRKKKRRDEREVIEYV